jgi:hypothetical protein
MSGFKITGPSRRQRTEAARLGSNPGPSTRQRLEALRQQDPGRAPRRALANLVENRASNLQTCPDCSTSGEYDTTANYCRVCGYQAPHRNGYPVLDQRSMPREISYSSPIGTRILGIR